MHSDIDLSLDTNLTMHNQYKVKNRYQPKISDYGPLLEQVQKKEPNMTIASHFAFSFQHYTCSYSLYLPSDFLSREHAK